ncbi:4-hydroxy-tetrahydrodipicolinate synthase [Treponema socranskii subsp. socranskii VPI DR56BR1116 = ATCC 35536]|uniref:4-hydroxy-tetrahydrodipicolinate synthase n=1 Tax=Treponema socranskii subsp. socranskii VPI DR56BR1116 = ATCC 35536 TaxID=1125725 RepID=U2MY36_TRESO|nr:4-hydroxy-tetrahydrodipicolinate synthase [Treponema socranskii]ERF60213.1 4-hydroxy-tetrahydrodipicolinate synthase [Treponema socranskii subsp. socranskii VPI DR56BR1116 = ATCC 35536]ERK04114.1 4-hydroxy-tetrahydrodipicolinate synthase [Treponema socranskii subsp. socranskii VPI DR56BR1116 = ATCC 35536]
MIRLRGAFTAMITPIKEDGSIDYDGYRKLLRFQMEESIDGLVPLGTTGETPTLDEDEEQRIIDVVMEEVRAFEKEKSVKVPVVLGAGSNNTRDAVRYTERAKKAGADAALVVTPYYNKPSSEGIFRHFEAVSRVGIPILVYNIAGRTGKNIDTPTLSRIADLPNIAGVKEASGSISQMTDVIDTIKSKHPDFAVLSGDDAMTLPLIACGGDGVVSVVSNAAPALVSEMVRAALSGDYEAARKIHYRLLPFFKAAFVDGNPTSIKYAMRVKGLPSGSVRLPLVDVHDEAKKIIEEALSACGL